MRHKSSLGGAYFERMYADDPDPWRFETSPYEKAKYDHTIAALPAAHFRRVFEVGCANGILTRRLAERCDELIAVDIVDRAIATARRRCADIPNVDVRKVSVPEQVVEGPFDLVVLSEVAYYWDSIDLQKAATYFSDAIEPGGHILLVHWIGETDYPKSGDEAVAELRQNAGGAFVETLSERLPEYRLDIWRKTAHPTR
jgi:SAM-dependent methyltransferase